MTPAIHNLLLRLLLRQAATLRLRQIISYAYDPVSPTLATSYQLPTPRYSSPGARTSCYHYDAPQCTFHTLATCTINTNNTGTITVTCIFEHESAETSESPACTYDSPYAISHPNYYGYRYYSPSTGRWINRDPMGELTGINIYLYAQNASTDHFDILGLISCSDCTTKVVEQVLGDSNLLELYKRLRNDNIPDSIPPKKCLNGIFCKCCLDPSQGNQAGRYGPEPGLNNDHGVVTATYEYNIVICCADPSGLGNPGTSDVIETLYHEMQHAAEKCYNKKQPSSCKEEACAEARARFCSGMSESAAKEQAYLSARDHELCDGFSDKQIRKFSEECHLSKDDCYIQRPPITSKEH